MGKYDQLFFEFKPQETNWGDWCHSPQAYFRGDKDIPDSNLNVGFQVIKAPVYMEREPHFHREEEYLFFMGAKLPDVFSSFDAEIELYVGKSLDEMERIVITEPTVVRIPKGVWHCPLNFKRVDKPIFFQAALQHGSFGSVKQKITPEGRKEYIYVGDEARPCTLKADKTCDYCGSCFDNSVESQIEPYWTVKGDVGEELKSLAMPLVKEVTNWGDWCPSPQTYFRGDTYMKDAQYHVGFQVFTADNDMEEPHFHQGRDEYIFFMGADPMNIFDFDAEIDFYIGEHRDEMELYKITKPTVVRIPPTMWHCPIYFRKMNKPLIFQAAWQAGCWGTISRAKLESGEFIYTYSGDNVRFCRFKPGRRCTICGKCPGPAAVLDEKLK